jgi:RNA recognition motif-containing protein
VIRSHQQTVPLHFINNIISTLFIILKSTKDTNGYVIRELFGEHGEVEKVFIPKNRATGKPKGMAFVTMGSEEQRDLAIEKLNDTELDGRTIYVDKSKPRTGKAEDVKGV